MLSTRTLIGWRRISGLCQHLLKGRAVPATSDHYFAWRGHDEAALRYISNRQGPNGPTPDTSRAWSVERNHFRREVVFLAGAVRSKTMKPEQSRGRAGNAATPGGKPTPDEPDEGVLRVGRESRQRAGPDGPDATVVGDIFKRPPDRRRSKETGPQKSAERPPNG